MHKQINNISIHYEIIGKGQSIIFLHGLCLDLNSMKLNYEPLLLQSRYQRIYIDLPGMGESDSFSKPQPSGDYLLELIVKFIDKLNIGNFYLCGHSYGGYLALGIAYKYPKRVKGLFLSCPVVTANPDNRITENHVVIKNKNTSFNEKINYNSNFLKMNVIINDSALKKYLDETVTGLKKCNFNFVKRLRDNNFSYYQLNEEPRIKKMPSRIPIFLLLGKHDHFVGYKEQVKLAMNFKKCNLLVLENAGHNLQIDQPELFASCVKYFFA
ncbi:alpha/beta fold hydrolase [Liquorilactobacillus oeni]|nr:alpha/beta hydrolase [Liquorilactobacillus oeni]